MFTDICYYDGSFKYIVEDEAEQDVIKDEFTVDLTPAGGYSISAEDSKDLEGGATTSKWAPEIVTSKEFIRVVGDKPLRMLPHTHVYYISYNAENFGHFLSDELYPIYSILSAFGELQTNVQLIR